MTMNLCRLYKNIILVAGWHIIIIIAIVIIVQNVILLLHFICSSLICINRNMETGRKYADKRKGSRQRKVHQLLSGRKNSISLRKKYTLADIFSLLPYSLLTWHHHFEISSFFLQKGKIRFVATLWDDDDEDGSDM